VQESKSPLALIGSPGGDPEIIGGDLDSLSETKNQKWEMDRGTSRRLLGGAEDEKHREKVKTHVQDTYKA